MTILLYNKRIILRFYLLVGIFMLFLSSCNSRKQNQHLLYAESLMNEYPDSALILLENISSFHNFSCSDKALYALLLTQALHKNHITLEDDSLIKVAVDYYGEKKSLRAAQAYYYWGAVNKDIGNRLFAVELYLKSIHLIPSSEESFLAIIYDNLAECYEEEDLYDAAMESYKMAFQILSEDRKQRFYPLRGMAHLFLLQNQLDSALHYFQKAFDDVLTIQDSAKISNLYSDLATVYYKKKKYHQANEYITKSIPLLTPSNTSSAYHLKGLIMLELQQFDSARYYFDKNIDNLDIYARAVRYDGLYQVEKRTGNWRAAVQNADAYMILYDSIQILSDSQELDRLMDNYQLEMHKKNLSQHAKTVIIMLIIVFFLLVFTSGFCFLWNDRKRKKYYITLQQELVQKRVDVMLLSEEDSNHHEKEHVNRLAELREQQLKLCISMFETTECYKKLQAMEIANHKQLKMMGASRLEINVTIRKVFIDVMTNLKECCTALTNDDLFYCVLSLMHCSNKVIMELMNVSPDALKMRRSRIKSKLGTDIFEYIFNR